MVTNSDAQMITIIIKPGKCVVLMRDTVAGAHTGWEHTRQPNWPVGRTDGRGGDPGAAVDQAPGAAEHSGGHRAVCAAAQRLGAAFENTK